MGEPTLYAVLDVPKSASAQDIKRAYYALAHRFHPDKLPDDPDATERFRQATFAYAVLSDTRRRKLYDRFGRFGLKLLPDAPRGGGGALTPQGALRSIVDLVAEELRVRVDGLERTLKNLARGEDEHLSVNVTPTLLLCGGQLELRVRRATPCAPCEGSGAQTAKDRVPCRFCSGTGQWHLQWGALEQQQSCAICQGRGYRIDKRCNACRGKGMQYPFTTLQVRVPAKTSASRTLRLASQGGIAKQAGAPRGDLLVHLRAISDAMLKVSGHDLRIEWPLTPKEAALGGPVDLPMPDGMATAIVPPHTQPGDCIEVEGAGLYNERMQRGRLLVHALIEIPTQLNDREAQCWSAVEDRSACYPRRLAAAISLSKQQQQS